MADDTELGCKLAAYLREDDEAIARKIALEYKRLYPSTKSSELPLETRVGLCRAQLLQFADELEGNVNPRRFLLSGGGDMVVRREKSLACIGSFAETELFFARCIAPACMSHFAATYDGSVDLEAIVPKVEETAQRSVKANVETFLQSFCVPGALMTDWEYILPLADAAQAEDSVLEELTDREQDVLELLLDGTSNKGIANTLGLKLNTVKNYVSRILEKRGASSRSELLAKERAR